MLEEIAFLNRWINKNKLEGNFIYGNCDYSKYLKGLLINYSSQNKLY